MQELEVTWVRAIKVWWSMIWRVVAVSILAGFVAGIIVGIVAGILGFNQEIAIITRWIGIILGIPIGIWAMKVVLMKEYADFRIALLPSSEAFLEQHEQQAGKE